MIAVLALMVLSQMDEQRVVVADIANIRKSADEKAPIAARLRINSTVQELERANGWVEVQAPGAVHGFVRAELLAEKPIEPGEALAAAKKFREGGDAANALTWASRAYAADPQSADAFNEFEQALKKAGKTKEAKEHRAEFEGRAPVYIAICGRTGPAEDRSLRAELLAVYEPGKGLQRVKAESEEVVRAVAVAGWYELPGKGQARATPVSLFPRPQTDVTYDGAGGEAGSKLTTSCSNAGIYATAPIFTLPPAAPIHWPDALKLSGLKSKDPYVVGVYARMLNRAGLSEAKLTFHVEVVNEPARSTDISTWQLFTHAGKPVVSVGSAVSGTTATDVREVRWARLKTIDDPFVAVVPAELHPFEDGKMTGESAVIVVIDAKGKVQTLTVELAGGGC